jgi:hypothetical protein
LELGGILNENLGLCRNVLRPLSNFAIAGILLHHRAKEIGRSLGCEGRKTWHS